MSRPVDTSRRSQLEFPRSGVLASALLGRHLHAMPRRPRPTDTDLVFHVMNRGARRLGLFGSAQEYAEFLDVLEEAVERFSMRLLAYVVMPNHWHMVVWPTAGSDLAKFMAWSTGVHVQRWHRARQSTGTGTIYQGRYKAIPVKDDRHLLTLCRYVERNPVRAGLVARAADWPWSSASPRAREFGPRLSPWPVARPEPWEVLLDQEQAPDEVEGVRQAIRTATPYGPLAWQSVVAAQLRWTLGGRPRGRPRKVGSPQAAPIERRRPAAVRHLDAGSPSA